MPPSTTSQAVGRVNPSRLSIEQRAAAKQAFLDDFRLYGNIGKAMQVAGFSRSAYYEWVERDPAFADAAAQAQEEAYDLWEQEAARRAFEGTPRFAINKDGVVYNPETGKPVIEVEYSDFLADKLLRAARPKKFGTKLEISHVETTKATDADILLRLQQLGVNLNANLIDLEAQDLEELPAGEEGVDW